MARYAVCAAIEQALTLIEKKSEEENEYSRRR
jgi:hypothetical protein